jgi:toxin ParE1/3/4
MPRHEASKIAQAEIKAIARFTRERWGKEQRRVCTRGLRDAIERLAEAPNLAVLCRDLVPPARTHPHGSHLIVFVDRDDGVLVLRVLHRSMDISSRLRCR